MANAEITILLTSAIEDSEDMQEWAREKPVDLLHLPLEKYVPSEPKEEDLSGLIESSENIIYGNKRNAKFFLKYVQQQNLKDLVINRVNLAGHQRAADYLEEHGIPAIYPGSDKPIKMLEFLMRLRRLGSVLYPCGSHQNDEIPGLLNELDIDVQERIFYELEGPSSQELKSYQRKAEESQVDFIVFHSRRSVIRTQAAFPGLAGDASKIIAGDNAVADKLKEDHNITVDKTAEGNWRSIIEKIEELVS